MGGGVGCGVESGTVCESRGLQHEVEWPSSGYSWFPGPSGTDRLVGVPEDSFRDLRPGAGSSHQ